MGPSWLPLLLGKILHMTSNLSFFHSQSHLISLVCCRFLIEGFVSKECGRFRFFPVAMAAAAATPIGPAAKSCDVTSSFTPELSRSVSSNALSGELGSLIASLMMLELMVAFIPEFIVPFIECIIWTIHSTYKDCGKRV